MPIKILVHNSKSVSTPFEILQSNQNWMKFTGKVTHVKSFIQVSKQSFLFKFSSPKKNFQPITISIYWGGNNYELT